MGCRAVGSHDMNDHSSRSHSILTITANGTSLVDGSTVSSKDGNGPARGTTIAKVSCVIRVHPIIDGQIPDGPGVRE